MDARFSSVRTCVHVTFLSGDAVCLSQQCSVSYVFVAFVVSSFSVFELLHRSRRSPIYFPLCAFLLSSFSAPPFSGGGLRVYFVLQQLQYFACVLSKGSFHGLLLCPKVACDMHFLYLTHLVALLVSRVFFSPLSRRRVFSFGRAPRLASMPYDEDGLTGGAARGEKRLERRRDKLRRGEVMETLREEFGEQPETVRWAPCRDSCV